MAYKIMCRTKCGVEEIDESEDMIEAKRLLAEYQIAFYNSYSDLWITKGSEDAKERSELLD